MLRTILTFFSKIPMIFLRIVQTMIYVLIHGQLWLVTCIQNLSWNYAGVPTPAYFQERFGMHVTSHNCIWWTIRKWKILCFVVKMNSVFIYPWLLLRRLMTKRYPSNLKVHVQPAKMYRFINSCRGTFQGCYLSSRASSDTFQITYEQLNDKNDL